MRNRFLFALVAVVVATAMAFIGVTLVRAQESGLFGGLGQGPATDQDDDFGTVSVYAVNDDGSLDPAASGLTEHIWDTFKRVVTPQFANNVMSGYRVGDAPKSDTLAYVYQDRDPRNWILAANLATSDDDSDLIATLVHEYAHILTLDDGGQLLQHVGSCATLAVTEGCAADASYLWSFDQRFWLGYGDAPAPENTDGDAAYDFYLAHEGDFVDDYAATNVVEDIAESFMTFVLEDRPTGDGVAAQKLEFFWTYPELTAIRERIRAEFADDLGLVN